ncbi:MAG: hypothetical protein HPY83_08360 [Anaerolineae bacterium]|nr:hypothetical protein [Anaerolineae bacterium]
MSRVRPPALASVVVLLLICTSSANAWTPEAIALDPSVRMPGTQPNGAITFQSATSCTCHFNYGLPSFEIGFNWQGSLMSQSARDPLFLASMVVAAQDSIWAFGNPNAVDLCERCHFPMGWLRGHSDPPNGINFMGPDWEGVSCDLCHRMYDPFFQATFNGARERGTIPEGVYWDEATTASHTALSTTLVQDRAESTTVQMFNGSPFYDPAYMPPAGYTEAGSGQMFVSAAPSYRASFADAVAGHGSLYSRFHKSRYFCGTCHDVSNPVLANQGADPSNALPAETQSAFAYAHAERTFSEFALSAFGQPGGAAGSGYFAPGSINTAQPGDLIASCQDCHMRDAEGYATSTSLTRPTDSTEHPNSGLPVHDMTGGGAWVASILASVVSGSASYDATNASLLGQGPQVLTLDLTQGAPLNWVALQAGAGRARQQLQVAASLEDVVYYRNMGTLSFRIRNHTGHKLLTGYPEGRRMFVNIRVFDTAKIALPIPVYEINPYDYTVGTLKGLPGVASSPALQADERYEDRLVYEAKGSSSLTGEARTFHFALTTGRYKDNRIPPAGFDVASSAARLADPVYNGVSALNYFTVDEYAGGYDDVLVTGLPLNATSVEVTLFYQTTTREYVEFLRDEINGTATTLVGTGAGGDPPYIVSTDGFFSHLRGWGDTIWNLWLHNKDLPGAAPIRMASATAAESQVTMTFLPLVTRQR